MISSVLRSRSSGVARSFSTKLDIFNPTEVSYIGYIISFVLSCTLFFFFNLLNLAFKTSQEHLMLRESVRSFTETEIDPQAIEFNRVEKFNRPLFNKCGELGLLGVTVEEQVCIILFISFLFSSKKQVSYCPFLNSTADQEWTLLPQWLSMKRWVLLIQRLLWVTLRILCFSWITWTK